MTPAIDALPRFRLLGGPSPVHRLTRLEAELGGDVELWMKREDLLPLAFGGNKLRNLEFLVGAALAAGDDTLVTAGRRWSNHCRLTAAAGARAGLAVHLVLSGPPAADAVGPGLDAMLGATIHQLPTADRVARDAVVAADIERLRAAGRRPYLVPVGGSGLPGAVGQVLAGYELLDQLAAATPDVVVLATATGGTHAGVLAGLRSRGSTADVVGILVAGPETELRPVIESTLLDLAALTGVPVDPEDVLLDGSSGGAGYGRRDPEAEVAASLLGRTEGILADPIYTAKALARLITGVRNGRWDGRRVVFWHAGGTPGLFEPLDDPGPA